MLINWKPRIGFVICQKESGMRTVVCFIHGWHEATRPSMLTLFLNTKPFGTVIAHKPNLWEVSLHLELQFLHNLFESCNKVEGSIPDVLSRRLSFKCGSRIVIGWGAMCNWFGIWWVVYHTQAWKSSFKLASWLKQDDCNDFVMTLFVVFILKNCQFWRTLVGCSFTVNHCLNVILHVYISECWATL